MLIITYTCNGIYRSKEGLLLLDGIEIDHQYQDYFMTGECAFSIGMYEEAIENFKNAIKYNPEIPHAYCNLIISYFKRAEENFIKQDLAVALDAFVAAMNSYEKCKNKFIHSDRTVSINISG